MAQSAYEMCVKALEDEQGEIPVEWKCWGIELDIARAKWEEACEAVECAPSSRVSMDYFETDVCSFHRNAIKDYPTSADVTLLQSLILFLTGKLANSSQQILATLRMDPDNGKAKQLRLRVKTVERLKEEGRVFFKDAQWAVAVAKYSEAIEVCIVMIVIEASLNRGLCT